MFIKKTNNFPINIARTEFKRNKKLAIKRFFFTKITRKKKNFGR